jgi:hypothetical protein
MSAVANFCFMEISFCMSADGTSLPCGCLFASEHT